MNNNIVEFKREESTWDHIQLFLESQDSENTSKKYEGNIKRFLNWKFKNVSILQIAPSDVNNIRFVDMEKYRNYLKRKYSGNTVNNNLFSVYSLFKYLIKIQNEKGEYLYNLNVERLRVKTANTTDSESYGDVSFEEVQSWIDYIKESSLPRKENKWIFFHIAVVTGLRKQALSDLTFRDLRKNSDDIWQLKSTLKGKTKRVSIREGDAHLLLSLWKNKNDKDEKILKLSTKSMERLMSHVRDEVFEVPEERNVTLHSLRYLSGWEAYKSSGNSILSLQSHLGHSSMETSWRYVQQKQESMTQASLYMKGDINENDVKDLTLYQWQDIFKHLSHSVKYDVINKAKELGYSQE